MELIEIPDQVFPPVSTADNGDILGHHDLTFISSLFTVNYMNSGLKDNNPSR
jgi:hypothetical protein